MRKFILDYLEQYFDEIEPFDFYRAIFPPGELEEKGKQTNGKYNAIAVEILPQESEKKVNRYLIHDDLKGLNRLFKSDNFTIISPISYAGKSRISLNARYIYAMAIDFDGITEEKYIIDLFHQMKNNIIPNPTYIVFSGSGLHLYYQFEKPIPCFKNIVKQLSVLKHNLTWHIWNRYTTSLYKNIQYESLFQGFRLVGGVTKDGNRTKAFITGEKVTIEYLNQFVGEEYRVTEYTYKSELTLAEAKEKYPEWYQKRVIEKQPIKGWVCNRAVYDWWKKEIKVGARVGHRYFCIMCLAIYAQKCGISREELEEDAFSYLKWFDAIGRNEGEEFTKADILAALEMYNDNYIRFPIDSITKLTAIPIEKNKRNFRTSI